jgi:alpha-1,3-rhamnosyltransferase
MENITKNDTLEQPLVSIIVITYNSSKYVLETLESAKAQTYQNIELIVSDDCSTDNTVEICREWIENNKERFVRTELITAEKNTGIPANCNRGVKAAQGEWVKLIAGDDILLPETIFIYNKIVTNKSQIIVSRMYDFYDFDLNNLNEININTFFLDQTTPEDQFTYFLKNLYITTPTLFCRRSKVIELRGFDERYKLVEDIPFFLKCTYNNVFIEYSPEITVLHRRHKFALTSKNSTTIIPNYIIQVYYAIKAYGKEKNYIKYWINANWHIGLINIIFFLKNKGIIAKSFNYIRLKLQPIRFFNLLEKIKKLL